VIAKLVNEKAMSGLLYLALLFDLLYLPKEPNAKGPNDQQK